MTSNPFDVLILGGGPAGLSTALVLARVKRTALVISNGSYRNDGIHEMHGVLGHDKWDPSDFRKESRKQIEAYGDDIQFQDAEIVKVGRATLSGGHEGFEVVAKGGQSWSGKKLVLAMGSKDVFPDIPGYAENWPDNIYQCLICDGRERAHLPFGAIGFPSPMHLAHATMMRNLGGGDKADVTVFTNGDLPQDDAPLQEAKKAAESLGIKFESQMIKAYERAKAPDIGLDVCLEDGTKRRLAFIADKPPTVSVGEKMLVDGLGVEISNDPLGSFITRHEPFGSTSVKGCFVAGDAGMSLKQVTMAVAHGVGAAAGAMRDLCTEEGERALAAVKKTNVEEVELPPTDVTLCEREEP